VPRLIPGGFTVDDFTVDHQDRTATCPNGLTRPISRNGFATFGTACSGCPLRAQPQGNKLKVGPMTRRCAPPGRQPETRTGWPNTASIGP